MNPRQSSEGPNQRRFILLKEKQTNVHATKKTLKILAKTLNRRTDHTVLSLHQNRMDSTIHLVCEHKH